MEKTPTPLYKCFSSSLNCTNGTKLGNASYIFGKVVVSQASQIIALYFSVCLSQPVHTYGKLS